MVNHQDSKNIKYKSRVKVETQQSISYCLKAINKPPTFFTVEKTNGFTAAL